MERAIWSSFDFDSNAALQELQKSEGLSFRRPGVGGPAPGIVNDADGFHCAPTPRWSRHPAG